jgi:hypothetical protein
VIVRPVTSHTARVLLLVIAAASVSACQGKGVGGSCADVAGCGGNLVGKWQVNGFCQYEVDPPSSTNTLPAGYTTPQTPTLASPMPTTNTGDWCQGLVVIPADGGAMATAGFFQPPSNFMTGTLDFEDDGTYQFMLTGIANTVAHFSLACIAAHGAAISCTALATDLNAVPNVNYTNVRCSNASDGGCDCSLSLGDSGFDHGTWALDSTKTVVYETSTNAGKGPQAASFCVDQDNNTLTLSGYDGATLIGGPAGLRTLTASRM